MSRSITIFTKKLPLLFPAHEKRLVDDEICTFQIYELLLLKDQ